jgi:peptide/nickel transport system ATP-binding protein
MSTRVLTVENLRTHFATERGRVTAVDGVSFSVDRGETLGLVGESGCGKSVTAESLMRLLDERSTSYEGRVHLLDDDLLGLPEAEMRRRRGRDIAMIFQDPMSSLNPVFTVGDQLVEGIRLHQGVPTAQARAIAIRMLELTNIPAPDQRMREYPHQLSGGMRQRVMIAMALSTRPKLLIADEPTTALDVTTQAQILDLIEELRTEFEMGTIFITHDLGVVAETCDRVAVMYLGQIIAPPLHPRAARLDPGAGGRSQRGARYDPRPGPDPAPRTTGLPVRGPVRPRPRLVPGRCAAPSGDRAGSYGPVLPRRRDRDGGAHRCPLNRFLLSPPFSRCAT